MQVSAAWTGIKIWAVTVFFNAVLVCIGACWEEGIGGILIGFGGLFFGSLITMPLLGLIIPVVHLSRKLPYDTPAKIAWVGFWLAMIIVGFYAFGNWLFDGKFFSYDIDMIIFNSVNILALFLSMLVNRGSLRRLNEAAGEKPMSTYTIH